MSNQQFVSYEQQYVNQQLAQYTTWITVQSRNWPEATVFAFILATMPSTLFEERSDATATSHLRCGAGLNDTLLVEIVKHLQVWIVS
jgi:hypothetical protein